MKTWTIFAAELLLGWKLIRCDSCQWRTRRGQRTLQAHRENRCLG